ncbi:MAG: PQQ-dependent sugar dehydrogenase [Zavarzinella sp.]|nr:PQQ-dependent sugar dehydrogenase [Zavarzinella sp.]
MNDPAVRTIRFVLVAALASAAVLAQRPSAAAPAAEKRVAWTTSKVTGSPEPPHPYRVVPAFPKLKFRNPLHLTSAPGTDRLFVLEHTGKIFSLPNRADVDKADLVIDTAKDLTSWKPGGKIQGFDAVYGMTFHPKFEENRYCYVCYVLKGKGEELADGSRVSRFTVSKTDPPKIDPASEKILFTFLAGGHNGGCLAFGPDGYLYISTGDSAAPNPPDPLNTGQDCSDLLSSVLRIDVDHEDAGKAYSVPKDNPFVGLPDVRPEIWAFGFRNPWKMSFDRATGELWLGDVGWELWEMVYRVKKGGNYGWSIKEGPQPIKPEGKIGPTPILPPLVAFPHSEAASITGGYVYRGKRHKDLVGAYICGDWMTRKYWAIRADGDKPASVLEIAQASPKVVSFAEDNAGELYILDYNEPGGIYVLEPNPDAAKPRPPFPTRLSETGLFADVAKHVPAPGVYPYEINAEPWADHAKASRLVGLPGTSSATFYRHDEPVPNTAWFKSRVFFPKDGVLTRTFSLEMEHGNPTSARKLETQLLHFDGTEWRGYTYRWADDQTDAVLVPATGEDAELTVKDGQAPGGVRKQTWHFPSRAECRQCHNPWAGELLGFTESQLRRPAQRGEPDMLTRLVDLNLIAWGKTSKEDRPAKTLVNPHSAGSDLEARARSYLHVNCAHCHQFGAGGSVNMELKFETALDETRAIDAKPAQGTFGLPDGRIIAPGDPYRSLLYYRMAKQGRGRMPHIGSELVDEAGVRLIGDWIRRLPPQTEERTLLASVCNRDPKWKPAERKAAIEKLLGNPAGALMLQEAWDAKKLPDFVRPQVLAAAATKDAAIRDLFERYVPDSQKVKRLGTVIRPESLLGLKGDPARGKDVFFKTTGLQCATCHTIAGQGGQVGPDLSDVGKRQSKRQILESILDPSKDIDPKYAAYIVEVDDGRQLSGLIVARDDQSLTIRDPQGKDTKLPLAKVVSQIPSKKSLMPDQLLRDLTAEQAADLLAFLESLKGK